MLIGLTSVLAVLGKELVDLIADFTVGNLDIVLGGAIVGHEGEEAVVGDIELQYFSQENHTTVADITNELILLAADIGDVHVVGGRAEFFQLLAR